MTSFADPAPQRPQESTSTSTATVVLTANVSDYQRGMAAAASSTSALSSSVDTVATKLSNASKTLGHAFENAGKIGLSGIGASIADAAAFQHQLAGLNATAAITGVSMPKIKRNIEDTFTSLPVSRRNVVQLTETITNLGVTGARNIGQLTNTFVKLGAATDENSIGLASGLVQLSRQLGNTDPAQIARFANSLLTVSKNAGVSATGVLNFSQAIAPVAREAGIGEAAVLGISTAFEKSGSNGYRAATAFNQILSDITNLTQTGNPQLAMYASFIGKTADEFRKMPAKDQITAIFDAINQGGPKALNFVNALGLGSRALVAVQGVAQSGGLTQAINTALASSSSTDNLNKGAHAAMSGFDDSLTRFRNEITEAGEILGGPFLKGLTIATNGLADAGQAIDKFLRLAGPVPAAMGTAAGVAAPLVGFGLAHVGLIGTAALVRSLFRSGPRRALTEGRQVGAAVRGGLGAEEAMAGTTTGAALLAGSRVPWQARGAFFMGRGLGGAFGAGGGEPGAFRTHLNAAALQVGRQTPRALFGIPAWFIGQQRTQMSDSQLADYQRNAYKQLGHMPMSETELSRMNDATKVRMAEIGVIKLTEKEMANLGRQIVGLGAEATKAAASMAEAAALAATGGIGGVRGAALRGGVRTAGMLGRGLSTIGRFALGPWGFAAMLGLPLVMGGIHSLQSKAQAGQNELSADLNPIQQYNSALGIATTNLADFSQGLKNATPKAGTQSSVTTFGQATTVTAADVAGYSGTKGGSDKAINAVMKYGSNQQKIAGATALLNSYGFTDPRQVDLFKQNLLAAGMSRDDVQKVMSGFRVGATPNFAALGQAINVTEGHGLFAMNASRSGSAIAAVPLSAIGSAKQADLATHSAAYAQTKYLSNVLGFLGGQAGSIRNTEGVKALAISLATLTGGKAGDFEGFMRSRYEQGQQTNPNAFNQQAFAGMTPAQRQQYLLRVIGSTKAGQSFLSTITSAGGTINPARFASFLSGQAGQQSQQTSSAIADFGALGRFATTNPLVVAAGSSGGETGNPAATQQAIEALSAEAIRTAGSASSAATALDHLGDATSGATQALAQGAANWARQLQGFALPTMTRNAQLGALATNLQVSSSAAAAPNAGSGTVQRYTSDLTAFEQSKESYRQYLVSTYQQAQQFGVQMQRAAEDEHTSEYRSQRDFYIQMTDAQQDYQRQTLRSRQDFAIQLQRQAQQAAETIYNPFQRVQAQYTTDAGTLVQNLEDQNKRITDQLRQLRQLRSAGVSQQAIDTLQLSSPQNAQELTNIAGSLTQNPQLVNKINQLVGARVSATTKLTQSSFTETFRNTVADFDRQMNRAAQDYDTSRKRAEQSQSIALSDMATDYHKMISRSAQDLQTAMTEITGSFAQMFPKTLSMVNQSLSKYAPGAAKIIDKELTELKAKYPFLFEQNWTGGAKEPGRAGLPATGRSEIFHFAQGGISLSRMIAEVSENGAEAHIPLDARGEKFMTALLTRSLAGAIVTVARSEPATTVSSTADHSVSYAGANITVQADDPNRMERALAAKRKLARLSSPVRH